MLDLSCKQVVCRPLAASLRCVTAGFVTRSRLGAFLLFFLYPLCVKAASRRGVRGSLRGKATY